MAQLIPISIQDLCVRSLSLQQEPETLLAGSLGRGIVQYIEETLKGVPLQSQSQKLVDELWSAAGQLKTCEQSEEIRRLAEKVHRTACNLNASLKGKTLPFPNADPHKNILQQMGSALGFLLLKLKSYDDEPGNDYVSMPAIETEEQLVRIATDQISPLFSEIPKERVSQHLYYVCVAWKAILENWWAGAPMDVTAKSIAELAEITNFYTDHPD